MADCSPNWFPALKNPPCNDQNEMARSHLLLLLLIVSIFSAARLATATDHIVGGHFGWNPNINYTLWSNNQTFVVNDLISFRYLKNMYNVFEVNETGYDNCTLDGATGNWSSGKDFILLDKPKRYYFVCGNGFCLNGMKVSVRVHPLPSPPSDPAIRRTASSAATPVRSPPVAWPVLLVVATVSASWPDLIGFGARSP